MVDAIRAGRHRAQHLRAPRQPRTAIAAVAVASDPGRGLADRRPADRSGTDVAVALRLALRPDEYVPDQPFRAVRAASGRHQPRWSEHACAALQDAGAVQDRAPSGLPRLY